MDDLRIVFQEIKGIDAYNLVEKGHILPIYVGIDSASRYSMFIITESAPEVKINSSEIISTFVGSRKDGRYGITFSLNDAKLFDQFVCFCEDVVRSSSYLKDSSRGADFVCARYLQWQKLFKKSNDGLLTASEIKGLLGEMCFLVYKMIPKYGTSEAILSWCGPEMSDQDFEVDNTWYEIKSTTSGSPSVRISSVEQLDTPIKGHLVVVYLDKTSQADSNRLTLNNMYYKICGLLESESLRIKLDTVLLSLGFYPNDKYDDYYFKFSGMNIYSVTETFPCIRKSEIPIAASEVKYDLSIAAIGSFKEE